MRRALPLLLFSALVALAPLSRVLAQTVTYEHAIEHAIAPNDSSRLIPRWLHPWFEAGGGWLSGPAYLHSHYASGQSFAAGLEARPRRRFALRGAVDYQTLLANRDVDYVLLVNTPTQGVVLDTVPFTYQSSAWRASARIETGFGLPGDFWITGGGGGGYMNSGFGGIDDYARYGGIVRTPVAARDGWGWVWTLAARYDFQPAPAVPLGIDVRHTVLQRGRDDLGFWSIRLCFRVPDLPRDKGRGRRGRYAP